MHTGRNTYDWMDVFVFVRSGTRESGRFMENVIVLDCDLGLFGVPVGMFWTNDFAGEELILVGGL